VNAREDDSLGQRSETTLRLGDHTYVRNANGNVRELRGYLHRRALTDDAIDSGAFLTHPEYSRFAGYADLNGAHAWRLQVTVPGGEPETLWIDATSGLPLRLEYLDGDGPAYVDYGDWHEVEGRKIAFRTVETDGDTQFDVVEQVTSVTLDRPVDAREFAPLEARRLDTATVHTMPLIERAGHVGTTVSIAGKKYFFLLDTGAQSILVDQPILKAAGVSGSGDIEVRGATRGGGLQTAILPSLSIDGARMDDVVVSSMALAGNNVGGLRFDGILGYPFFASALVEMDFAHHRLRFGPPGSFVPHGERVGLDVDRELAEATFGVGPALQAPFIVDTGNSGTMLLYTPFLDAHPDVVPKSAATSLNYGIGGSNQTYQTTLDELRIAGTHLYHQNVDVVLAQQGAFADRVDAGNVGLGVLRNFDATFDIGDAQMYLDPGAGFDDGRTRAPRT
jgi:predicted aspartyl protease